MTDCYICAVILVRGKLSFYHPITHGIVHTDRESSMTLIFKHLEVNHTSNTFLESIELVTARYLSWFNLPELFDGWFTSPYSLLRSRVLVL